MALAQLAAGRRFDKAFGVNVNLFWTTTADAELGVLSSVLEPGGVVHLVYEMPDEPRGDVLDRVEANFARHRFAAATRRDPRSSAVCVSGRTTT